MAEQTTQTQPQTTPVEGEKEMKITYEIGLTWTGARYNVLKVKAKPIEGENKWDITKVLDATAMLLWKYGVEINKDAIRGNRLVASWVSSLLDAHSCSGTLTVVLAPYKEPQDIGTRLYVMELKDKDGNSWMIKDVTTDITCSTNKYSHDIHLYFDQLSIIDRYDDRETECRDKCNSLPTQAKINKVHEILLTIMDALPLIGWYTGKYTIEEME
jgi:hypothetical protein